MTENNLKNTYKILYIEDDEDDFVYLKNELIKSKRGVFIVDWAIDVEEVFAKNLQEYDIFIVDYRLPTTDGIELMKNIQQKHSIDKPFVILTGLGSVDVDEKALSSGAYEYLIKEKIDQQILERTVLYCCERYKILKNTQKKSIILEMVLDSIHAAVFLLNENGKILITNQQAKNLFKINLSGSNFDNIVDFYPYSKNIFSIELKEKFLIAKNIDELKKLPRIHQGVIKLPENRLISCIINTDLIKKMGRVYKMISIVDNSMDQKEKQILIKQNKKLESDLKKYGIEKSNPDPIIDLVDNEIDKFLDLEERDGSY